MSGSAESPQKQTQRSETGTGGSARLGDFRSRVAGVGPQLGWSVNVGGLATDLNILGYKEFAAQHRPEGWDVYFTVSLSRARRSGDKAP